MRDEKMKKKCGECQHFTKRKNDPISNGICNLKDARTYTGYMACGEWRPIPYDRKRHKLTNNHLMMGVLEVEKAETSQQ